MSSYTRRIAKSRLKQLEATAKIVMDFLEEHNAPDEVKIAFKNCRRYDVWVA